jgi:hypothetical protein
MAKRKKSGLEEAGLGENRFYDEKEEENDPFVSTREPSGYEVEQRPAVDYGDRVVYFCQESGTDKCFYLFSNQTSDTIKDKINKAFGVQIK